MEEATKVWKRLGFINDRLNQVPVLAFALLEAEERGRVKATDALANFAKEIIRISWEGCDADGGTIEELALKHDLVKVVEFDPKIHNDTNGCAIVGDDWFVFAGPLEEKK